MKKLLYINPCKKSESKVTKKSPKNTSELLGPSGVITIVDNALHPKKDGKK